ncbi:lysylphosphatidylglycerol synthase transmembrane domain-containing protein [Methanoculleus bourgensis]|uniref:lysylphosphatidylglycerol synthase transmembrane domain-containing protein n=1 Tax=Methanoculleus bourgensis TaxID=83986 RepID=UPI0022EE091C|nr:lysylphosphatidylglycerol synthase transmembrane domain-containing protein [Methanoculleus bourgensis]GLI45421.1 hypothetical protein MBOURGENBZM_02130 [Methanoculleus bourgensis]
MKRNTTIKILLTIGLFIAIFTKVHPEEVIGVITTINPAYLGLALLIVPLLYIVRTYRWSICLQRVGMYVPFTQLFGVVIIGLFYGLITPGKLGELGRVYHLNMSKATTLPTVFVEKLIDLFILTILSLVTIILVFQDQAIMIGMLLTCMCVIIIATGVLVNRKTVGLFARIFGFAGENVDSYVESISSLIKHTPTMSRVVLSTVGYYTVSYIIGYFILLSLCIDTFATVTLPIIVLIGNVPITISGLGLRESVGALCFVLLGIDGMYGFSFSLILFVIITLVPGLVGYALCMKPGYSSA